MGAALCEHSNDCSIPALIKQKINHLQSKATSLNIQMKINANFRAFAGVNVDATKYIPSPFYGVNRFMLDRIGSEKAQATTIVEYQPFLNTSTSEAKNFWS
jgi:hypothetical protein